MNVERCAPLMLALTLSLTLALALALAPPSVLALASDREQPALIESDAGEMDHLQGIGIYRGNVVYTQGTMRLEADTIYVHLSPDRESVIRVEAVGAPVRFRQRIEGHDEDLRGEALRIEYFADPERLVLEQQAHIWRLNTEFAGEVISYDPQRGVVNARRGEAEGDGRVQIIIQPQQGRSGGEGAR